MNKEKIQVTIIILGIIATIISIILKFIQECLKNVNRTNKIVIILNGDITAYKIAKELSVQPLTIQKYINGERKIENMTLATAEKLYEYYIKIKLFN